MPIMRWPLSDFHSLDRCFVILFVAVSVLPLCLRASSAEQVRYSLCFFPFLPCYLSSVRAISMPS